jgi:fumarate reductase (CoM/CoB) subunit A
MRQAEDGQVCGAVGLVGHYMVSIDALAVILATGGAGRLFARSVNTPDVQGDGWAMACAAGARFVNMEFFQVGPAVVHPLMKFIIHSHMWRLKPRLTNAAGFDFLPGYCPSGISAAEVLHLKAMSYPFSVRTAAMYVDIAIFREIVSGRGTPHGGVYFDVSHISRDEFLAKAPITYQRLLAAGVDLIRDKLELGLAVQNFNGGILIDEHGFTGITGLYAAGEVTGGVHGSDRPGGNNLTDTQVFGHRAGLAAARAARELAPAPQAAAPVALLGRLEADARDKEVIHCSAELFYREMTIVRNAQGLRDVLDFTSSHLDDDLGMEAKNRLIVGQLLANAMLLREESRGTHYREDHPARSPEWTKRIVVSRSEDGSVNTSIQEAF